MTAWIYRTDPGLPAEPSGLALENREQVGGVGEVFCRRVDRRGELAFEMVRNA